MQIGAQGGTCGAYGKQHAFLLWLGVCAVNPVEYLGDDKDGESRWHEREQRYIPIGYGF